LDLVRGEAGKKDGFRHLVTSRLSKTNRLRKRTCVLGFREIRVYPGWCGKHVTVRAGT